MSRALLVVLVVVAAGAGCSVASFFTPSVIACVDDDACPPQTFCVDGACNEERPDDVGEGEGEGEGETPGEGEGEGEGEDPGEGEGEGEGPAEGEGEGEGEGELPTSLPARLFTRVNQPVTVVLVLPAGTTLTPVATGSSIDVVVTGPVGAEATTSVRFTGRTTGTSLVRFTLRSADDSVDSVDIDVVVRPADWHVLEADQRLRVRKRVSVATGVVDVVVPIRVDTDVEGRLRFYAPVASTGFADDGAPLPAAPDGDVSATAAAVNTTWWVAMPAGANTVVFAYAASSTSPDAPSPWRDYLAVFHLDGDLEDAVSGTALTLPMGNDISFGTDSCLINRCARVGDSAPGVVISTRDLGTHSTLSLLATVRSNDIESAESPLIGVRDGEATTAAPVLGVRAGGGNIAAVTLDDDDDTIVARSALQFGFLERQFVTASLAADNLALFLGDRQVNSSLTPRVPTPLTSIVLGNDGPGGRVVTFVDEIRLRGDSVSVIAARFELNAMKDNASSVEVELAP